MTWAIRTRTWGLMRIFRVVLIAALSSLGLTPCAGAGSPSAQYRGLQTLDIPFANGPIAMDRVPHVWLKLRGSRPVRFGMDTGSTGIVVAAEHFTPGPNDIAEGPGRLIYNSSGRILNGERYTTEVEIQRDENTPSPPRACRCCASRPSPAWNARATAGPRAIRAAWPSWAWASTAPARRAPSPACRAIPSSAWSRSPRARRSRRCGRATS